MAVQNICRCKTFASQIYRGAKFCSCSKSPSQRLRREHHRLRHQHHLLQPALVALVRGPVALREVHQPAVGPQALLREAPFGLPVPQGGGVEHFDFATGQFWTVLDCCRVMALRMFWRCKCLSLQSFGVAKFVVAKLWQRM